MAKGYEDLSRRALIKLGKDFDQENEAALLHYLSDHSDEYENIRPMEKIMVKTDKVVANFKGVKNAFKRIINEESEKIMSSVIDAVVTASSETERGLTTIKEKIEV